MSVEYIVYRAEILNFLRTLTIKYVPLAKQMNANLLTKYGYVVKEEEDSPYYLNLCGLYHSTDTPIKVTTLETGTEEIFDRTFVDRFPKTAALYRIPNKEYQLLEQKYPDQTGLIKSIVYPVDSLQTAITAPNLSVLRCDLNQLPSLEQESMYQALTSFLVLFEDRWYIPDYDYEELYPLAFWGALWYLLPQVLLAQRIANLRTNQVHPLHIWEYLASHGLADYRDILTDKQSLFLYRNIRYLQQNKGKKSTLEILARNILKDMRVSLVGKTIFQQSATAEDECRTIPEIISDNVITFSTYDQEELGTYASMAQINARMINEGLEVDSSAEHVVELEEQLGQTAMNVLPTKLLELRKDTVSTRYEEVLCRFVMDSLMYRYSAGKAIFKVKYLDEVSGLGLELSIGEAIALFQYAYHQNANITLGPIPTIYHPTIPYWIDKPVIPDQVYVNHYWYQLRSLVDVDQILLDIPWDNGVQANQNDFMYLLSRQFRAMMYHMRQLRQSADLEYNQAMSFLYDKLMCHEPIGFSLVPFSSYQRWIESNETLANLINVYNRSADRQTLYWQLAAQLIETLLPIDNEWFDLYLGATKDKTAMYNKLKQLFIQLCSYNVAFLDTDRSKNRYLYITPLCLMETEAQQTANHVISLASNSYSLQESVSDITRIDPSLSEVGDIALTQQEWLGWDANLTLVNEPVEQSHLRLTPKTEMSVRTVTHQFPDTIVVGPSLTFGEPVIQE